jgi:hypothetical protein
MFFLAKESASASVRTGKIRHGEFLTLAISQPVTEKGSLNMADYLIK